MDMSTEQNVLEKLVPPDEFEVRAGFVDAIKRPQKLAKPTRFQRFRNMLEERFCFGELGIATGCLAALLVSSGTLALDRVAVSLVFSLVVARMLTAFVGVRVRSTGAGVLAGMAGVLGVWAMWYVYTFFRRGPSFDELSAVVEWMKFSLMMDPLRLGKLLVFGGGVSGLVTFLARRGLDQKPWLLASLHTARGRRVWRGLAVSLFTFLVISASMSPTSKERKTPSDGFFPLAFGIMHSLEEDDLESANRILTFYPDALEWYFVQMKVTAKVNSLETARFVVEHGGDFSSPLRLTDILSRAVEAKNDPLMEYLLAHGADPNAGSPLPLVLAVEQQRHYAVQVLLDHGAHPRWALKAAEALPDRAMYFVLMDAQK
jgi:hypothetical protein